MSYINKIQLAKNFYLNEFQCPCCQRVMLYPEVVIWLQCVRNIVCKPLFVTSGYRCEVYNVVKGGESKSQHLIGAAPDISVVNHNPVELQREFLNVGFKQVIYYRKKKIIHCAIFKKNPLM